MGSEVSDAAAAPAAAARVSHDEARALMFLARPSPPSSTPPSGRSSSAHYMITLYVRWREHFRWRARACVGAISWSQTTPMRLRRQGTTAKERRPHDTAMSALGLNHLAPHTDAQRERAGLLGALGLWCANTFVWSRCLSGTHLLRSPSLPAAGAIAQQNISERFT